MHKLKGLKADWEKFFRISCYGTVLLLPVVFLPSLILDYELPKVAFFRSGVMAMLLFYVLGILKAGKLSFKNILFNRRIGRFLLFVIVGALAVWFMATARDLSYWGSYFRMQGLYTQAHYLLFVILLFLGLKNAKEWKMLSKMLIWGYTIALIYGLIQGFGFDPFGYNLEEETLGRVFSFLGNPNYFASYILLVFFPLLSICLVKKEKWQYGLLLLSLGVLMLTASRAAFLGLMMGFSIVVIFRHVAFKEKKLLKFCAGMLVLATLLVGLANVFSSSTLMKENPLMERLVINEENLRSLHSRLLIWGAMPEHLQENIFLGHGQDSFALSIANYIPEEINKVEEYGRMSDRAHNNLLQLLSDYGLVGLVAFLWLVSIMYKEQQLHFESYSLEEKTLLIGIAGAFTSIGVAHLFGFSVTIHFQIMCIYLAYLLQLPKYKSKTISLPKVKWQKQFLSAAVAFYCLSSVVVENILPVYADYQAQKGLDAIENGNGQLVVNYLKEANLLNPNQDYYAYTLASVLSQLEDRESALAYLEKAGDFNNGEDYFYYYLKGRILAKDCDASCDLANENYAKAAFMASSYAPNWFNWGKFLIDTGNCSEGVEKLEHYRDMLPDAWKNPGTQEYRLFYKHNPSFDDVAAYISFCEASL